MASSAFLQFWWTGRTRESFLSHLDNEELASLRLVCHDFSVRAAPRLFDDLKMTFKTSLFTKPARMAALNRIGHHVRAFTFNMPHSAETFLPPLLDPTTGEEETFIYEPYVQSSRDSASRLSNPTYGSWEMTDMLVKQYSPLFHAAANIPSFIRAFSAMPGLKHLIISCPGQEAGQRYRRSIVDYALISLRIAVERSKLDALEQLSLLRVHAGAVCYLNPIMGMGSLPNSAKRWKQIRKLTMTVDSIPFGPNLATDHLKGLHAYLQTFAHSVEEFNFCWLGVKGPCPLSIGSESCLQRTSPRLACPRRHHLALRPLRFPQLRDTEMENIVVDASQISCFITAHRHTIREFNFEDTHLRSGTWDEALAPLTRISGSDNWKDKIEEVMDVPLMISPIGLPEPELKKVLPQIVKPLQTHKPRTSKPVLKRFHTAGEKGRQLLWNTPDHMKDLLRNSIFNWI